MEGENVKIRTNKQGGLIVRGLLEKGTHRLGGEELKTILFILKERTS